MEKVLEKLKEFHDFFGVKVENEPTLIDPAIVELRYNLMEEENQEYADSCAEGNLVEVADALGDQLYILAGTMLAHGMQDKIMEVFNEIHASNMSKLGRDSKPIYREDGKVLKGPDYFRPDIEKILDEA